MFKTILHTAGCISLLAGFLQTANASPTDRNTLYGLTPTGTLLEINTSTGASTVVRQLPYVSETTPYYGTLSVYEGVFLTAGQNGVVAFGLTPHDELRLGVVNELSNQYDGSRIIRQGNLVEFPTTGLSRGWVARFSPPYTTYAFYQRELDPISRTDYPISSTDVYPATSHDPYWTCYPQSGSQASAFFGSTRSYFIQTCARNDGYSAAAPALIRADLVSGVWSKTLDAMAPIPNTVSALAADPATDGVLYVGSFANTLPYPELPGATAIEKLTISGSTFSYSFFSSMSGVPGITGLAFGPPPTDVPAPKNVTPLAPFANHPWPPIQNLFDLNNP